MTDTIMTNKKTAFDLLQDLDYIVQAATIKFMGRAVIDSEMFKSTLEELRSTVSEELEKARKIEVRQEKIYAEAESKSQLLLQSTEAMIAELDIVKEAELIAARIIDEANSEADAIRKAANETAENTISHGDIVKDKMITEGKSFIEDLLRNNLIAFEQQQNNLYQALDEQYKNLYRVVEGHRNILIDAYFESFPEQAQASGQPQVQEQVQPQVQAS